MIQYFDEIRFKMVNEQLATRHIESDVVLDAMSTVPRHLFVPEYLHSQAYSDTPLPIGFGQTVSQPFIIAYMTEQLGLVKGMKVLEIGTGSGYQSAILAHIGCDVYSIELLEELAFKAISILATLGFSSIQVKQGNGFLGWQEEAPFDAIIATAAPESVPEALVGQLKDGGRMIIPVGKPHSVQMLKLIAKKDGKATEKDLLPVRFVPMVE